MFLVLLIFAFFLSTLLETEEIFDEDYAAEKVCLLKISRFRVFKLIPPKSSSLRWCQLFFTLATSTVNCMTTTHQHSRTTTWLNSNVVNPIFPTYRHGQGDVPKTSLSMAWTHNNIRILELPSLNFQLRRSHIPYLSPRSGRYPKNITVKCMTFYLFNFQISCIRDSTSSSHVIVVNLLAHYNSRKGPMITIWYNGHLAQTRQQIRLDLIRLD